MQDFVDRNSVALSVDAGLSYSNCCFQPNRLSTPLGTRKASSSLLLSIPTAMDLHGGKLLVDREHRSKQCRGNRGERVWEEELTYYAEFALRQSHKDTFNRSRDHPKFLFSKMQVAGNHRKGAEVEATLVVQMDCRPDFREDTVIERHTVRRLSTGLQRRKIWAVIDASIQSTPKPYTCLRVSLEKGT